MLKFDDATEEKKLSELYSQEAEELAQVLSGRYGIPYVDLSKLPINTDALRLIPEDKARAAKMAGFKLLGRKLFLVLLAPNSNATRSVLEDLRQEGYEAELYLGSEASLARAWSRYAEISKSSRTQAGVIDISGEDVNKMLESIHSVDNVQDLIGEESATALEQGGVSGLLEVILAGGIALEASDIHLEPEEGSVRLRYRLDGVLQDVSFLDHKLYKYLLSRVKLVSGLKLNIQKSAQDGRFSIIVKGSEMEIRTSVLPGAYGESIVLRLLNPETIGFTFETLGVEPELLKVMEREIQKPNGLILLTGPTGSGKTTTLYAFLRKINTQGNKTITIEDPIEYHLEGINQTQVDPGKDYTFLTGLRSALRQDPDIIMVGEIRDSETAKIAINAALTGHLVFSTLHTNNAAGTIPRLIDLGINPKILDSAMSLSIAQRLVRVLCPKCKQAAAPTAEEKKVLDAVAESIKRQRPNLALPATDKIWRANAGGCPACNSTGYRGRQGVFEAIMITPEIAKLLVDNPNEREIKIAARPQGILDMRQDGVLKVLAGTTSLEELSRVVDLGEEIL